MKKVFVTSAMFALVLVSFISLVSGRQSGQGYIFEHEQDLAKDQPPPHNGTGLSTAYSFFTKAPGLKLTFRKRVLKKGAEIGYHPQHEDEIYYVVSGTGIMKMNN